MPQPRVRMRILDLDDFVWRRKRVGSQRDVAELAGCAKSYLGELEAGVKPYCSRAVAVGLSRALDCTVDELFVRANKVALPGAAKEVS